MPHPRCRVLALPAARTSREAAKRITVHGDVYTCLILTALSCTFWWMGQRVAFMERESMGVAQVHCVHIYTCRTEGVCVCVLPAASLRYACCDACLGFAPWSAYTSPGELPWSSLRNCRTLQEQHGRKLGYRRRRCTRTASAGRGLQYPTQPH